MSDKVRKTFSKIRTFAGDMDKVRKKHEKIHNQKIDEPTPKQQEEDEIQIEALSLKPAAGKHTTRQTTEKIPAFHELKTENKELNVEQEKTEKMKEEEGKKKKTKEKAKSTQNNAGYGATVITDTKKNKTKLIPSIIVAIKKWFKEATKTKKKKVPKYTIPETSRRKGVIQKATSKTASIFTADNETLKEQIRKRHLLESNKEKLGEDKRENEEPETSWSPYTETGFNLLEEPEKTPDVTQNVKIELKKQNTLKPENQENYLNQDSTEKKENKRKETTIIPEEETKTEEKEEKGKTVLTKKEKEDKLNVNTLTIMVLTLVVTAVLIIFSGQISLKFTNSKDSSSTSIEKILKNSSIETITLSSETVESLPQSIRLLTESANEDLSEIAITSVTGNEIGAAYVMEILGFKTLPALNKSITTIRFVTTKETKEMLLIKFIDKTTVLGGMLQWENNLANDLQTLFSLPSTNGEFKDKTIENIAFREFIDVDTNETIVLYGIIDENTLVITTNEKALEEILKTEFSH